MIIVRGRREMFGSNFIISSYLIFKDQADKEMETDEGIRGSFVHGFIQNGYCENREVVNLRFSNEEGVEPLISEISYDCLKEETIELAEEFRQLYTSTK